MDPELLNTIFTVIILIMSAAIHEFAHALAAYKLGDPTAQLEGRLTINPIPHLSFVGSLIVPALLVISSAPFIVGWAKPVPYNPYNLRNRRWGELIVAIAGPVSNLIIAIIFGILIRFAGPLGLATLGGGAVVQIFSLVVLINIVLMVFNMMPIPPLDGSKILFGLFPQATAMRAWMEKNSLILILVGLFFIWDLVQPIIPIIFNLIIGL